MKQRFIFPNPRTTARICLQIAGVCLAVHLAVIAPLSAQSVIPLSLPATPGDDDLRAFQGFAEPLQPVASSTETERAALAAAVNSWLERSVFDDFSALETFAGTHPESVWTPSILLNLGRCYYQTGYFSKAMEAWEAAWNKTKVLESEEAADIANASVAEWAVMLARIGRKDELAGLLESVSGRTFQGGDMVLTSGRWRDCGTWRTGPRFVSLRSLCIESHPHFPARFSPEGFLDNIASPPQGFP
jgi:hypothetical protein